MADTVERRLLSLCLRYLSELLQPYSHDEIPLLRCAKSRLTLWADDFGDAVGLYHTVECATFIKAPATVLLLDFARCLLATFDQFATTDIGDQLTNAIYEAAIIISNPASPIPTTIETATGRQSVGADELHRILNSLYDLSAALGTGTIARRLLDSSLLCLAKVLETFPDNLPQAISLRYTRGRLAIWANDFNGPIKLHDALDYSTYLKEPVILLLLDFSGCLLGGFHRFVDGGISEPLVRVACEAATSIGNSEFTIWNAESETSVAEELEDILNSLYDLSLDLAVVIESFPNPSLLEPQSWKTFYEGLIRDKFPAAPLYLIERFAEGNILVHKKLWPIHAEESTPLDTPSSTPVYLASDVAKVVSMNKPNPLMTKATTPATLVGVPIASQSYCDSGTGASVYPSGTSNRTQLSLPTPSVASSFQGQISWRMPPRPKDAALRSGFKCTLCKEKLHPMPKEQQWRNHVTQDILPYMCIRIDCNRGQQMFGSRDQWLRHEKSHLQDEEIEMECPFCREGFKQDDPDNDRYRHIRKDMESIRLLAVPRPAMFPDNDTFIASSACSVASDRTNQISNQTNDLLTKTQLFPASDVSATDKDVERGCRHFHPCMESIGLLSLPPPPLNSEEDDDKLEQCSCDSNNIEPLNSQPGSNFRKQPADGFETQLKALPNLTEFNQTIDRWFSLMHNSSEPTDTSDKGEEVKRVDNTDWYQTDLDFTDDDHGYDVDNGIGLESPNLSKPKNEFWDEE